MLSGLVTVMCEQDAGERASKALALTAHKGLGYGDIVTTADKQGDSFM